VGRGPSAPAGNAARTVMTTPISPRRDTSAALVLLGPVGDLLEVELDDAGVVLAVLRLGFLQDARPQFARQLAPGLAGVLLQLARQLAGRRRSGGAVAGLDVVRRLAARGLLAGELLGRLLQRLGRLLHRPLGLLRLPLAELALRVLHVGLGLLQRRPDLLRRV